MPLSADAFGHDDFMMVRAQLVREAGGAAEALIAATIYWRANLANANAYERDGYVWWNASQGEISDLTGLTLDQVRRAGRELSERGLVITERHQRGGIQDRSYSYRINLDTPMRENARMEAGERPHVEAGERPLLPSSQDSKKNNNSARATRMPDDLTWNEGHAQKANQKGLDVAEEFAKFQDHHLAKGSKFVDWSRAFHTWLNNARAGGGFGQRPVATTRPSRDQEIHNLLNGSLGLDNMRGLGR